jgi:outer membrane protein TolC
MAARDVEILKAELEARKRKVAAQVRRAFYELLRNYEELRLHDQQVAIAGQAVESARIKYTVGRAPQQHVLKAQIASSKLVEHLIMLEQEGDLVRAGLNVLLGRDPAAPLEVSGEYAISGQLPSMAELERIALENRSELAAASAAIRRSEAASRLARKSYTPDFTVSAGYMLMPPDSRFRNTYMAELSITLPWLNRRRHDAEIAEASAQTSALRAEYDARRTSVLQEIREALIRAETARKLVALYRDTLQPQAHTSFRAAAAAYQTDCADFLNLLDSQNMALDVESDYFRALSEYEGRLADLERAIGAPLPRDTHLAAPAGEEVRQ